MQVSDLEEEWRNELDAIWLRYQIDRNPEDKQKYSRLLKQFADLITCRKRPTTHEE